MVENKNRIVLFLGAGAVRYLGYKTTKEFYRMINLKDPFRNNPLWNKLIKTDIVIDIEYMLQILENIITIHEKDDDDHAIFRSSTWEFRNPKYGEREMYPIPEKPELDFYRNFLDHFYDIDISAIYFDTVDEFIQNIRFLLGKIRENIHEEYGRGIILQDTKTMGSLIDKLSNQASDFSIFTTNYESEIRRLVEQSYIVSDGFNVNRQFDPEYIPEQKNDKNLLTYGQLHGSIKWIKIPGGEIRNDATPKDFGKYGNHTIIYPTLYLKNNKYHSIPYNYYLDQFRKKMHDANICIIIGFSFRDEMSKTFSKFDGDLFIVDEISKDSNAYQHYIERLKKNGAEIDLDRINEKNVFLKGFPQYDDELFKDLLDQIGQYCKINLNNMTRTE